MRHAERNVLVATIQKHLDDHAWELPEGTRIVVGRRRFLKLKKFLGDNPALESDGRVFPIVEDRTMSDETLRFTDW